MDFERNYQIKILSKQLKFRSFSSSQDKNTKLKLDPWFVTGFSDAEAHFSISIYKDKRIKGRVAWVVKPSFQISLQSRDMQILLQMQDFFSCGNIISKNNRSEISFRVNSLQNLITKIIPHFINYTLLSQKAADFELFKQIVNIIKSKAHLTDEGLLQIINIRASMNLGLSDLQKSSFFDYKPVLRPNVKYT